MRLTNDHVSKMCEEHGKYIHSAYRVRSDSKQTQHGAAKIYHQQVHKGQLAPISPTQLFTRI